MASPNTPSTGDIWHLSIDDLLAPLPERTRLGGSGPFVINLSASSAPIDVPAKPFTGCGQARVYQVQRMEERRPRYRLRLGAFAQEDEADAVLHQVRDIYPGALTATADADDLRAIANLKAREEAPEQPPAKLQPAAAAVIQPASAAALQPPVPSRTAAPPAGMKAPAPPVLEVPVIPKTTASPPAAARPVATKPAPPPAPPPAMPPPMSPPLLTSALNIPARAPAPRPDVPIVAHPPEQVGKGVLSLETTQTVRALTTVELEEDASRWFVIQLSLAEQAFDPETVPNLDIFSVYRLYSVAGIDQGRIFHALRLGFFSEEGAARAVASYLTAFYDQPTIKRVSAAERQRFAAQPLEPRKDVGATGRQAVIEITNERYIRERRSGQAAVK